MTVCWMILTPVLLAQAPGAGQPAAGGNGAAPTGGLFDAWMLPMMMLILAAFYLMVLRPQKQKQRELQEMLQSLKENTPVVTIGGIVGTVVSFSKEGQEVVLRVDDKNNTRIRVLRSHIARPLKVDAETAGEAKELSKGNY